MYAKSLNSVSVMSKVLKSCSGTCKATSIRLPLGILGSIKRNTHFVRVSSTRSKSLSGEDILAIGARMCRGSTRLGLSVSVKSRSKVLAQITQPNVEVAESRSVRRHVEECIVRSFGLDEGS